MADFDGKLLKFHSISPAKLLFNIIEPEEEKYGVHILSNYFLFPHRTPDPEGKLPEESLGASALKQCFQRKGLS